MVLSQHNEERQELYPVAFFSKKLLPREENYATIEKECLAFKLGVHHFHVYLLGKSFVVETDHSSLQWLNRMKDGNARLTRWSLRLQPYTFTI